MTELPTAHPDVVYRPLGDEVVLVNLRTNQIFALNETGARFWELFASGKERPEIEAALTAEFDVAPTDLSREIDDLLAALARQGLVSPP